MTNEEFNESFRERTRKFAVLIYQLIAQLPPGVASRNIAFQLGKSGSSVGANFRAFCRGRSKNEKFSKICIVVEEADETEYWLLIIKDLKLLKEDNKLLAFALKESDEIIRITASIKNALR